MKHPFGSGRKKKRGGFSLVEATFSLGLLSSAFLILAPLLALGFKTARLARDNRATAEIAQTLIEKARQGTLSQGTANLDFQGNICASDQASYTEKSTLTPFTGNTSLTRLTLQVTPVGAPDRVRTYAVVFQAPQ